MRSAHTSTRQAISVVGMPVKLTTIRAFGASIALAVLLAGCTTGGTGGSADSVTGTTWSGVDTQDRPTSFTFDGDGTVSVTYFDDAFNDELDTWALDGTTMTVTVYVSEEAGSAVYTGEVDLGDGTVESSATMDLSATTTISKETFTVSLTRD